MSQPLERPAGTSLSSCNDARSSKSWMTRSLGTLMQLPKSTPLRALRWTTPEGPMPRVVRLPSRDQGRTIEVYIWVPPPATDSASNEQIDGDDSGADLTTPPAIRSAFTDTTRPCLVDFHGGGFVMGGPIEQAPWCAALARSGIVAVSVAYRLGPTWEFPAALHDAEDVVRAVLNSGETESDRDATKALYQSIDEEAGSARKIRIDPTRVALSGFSSGANVALNMLLDLPANVQRESGDSTEQHDWPSSFPPSHAYTLPALLFFPSLDARQAAHERNRPEGMGPPSGMSKFIGRTMKNAYIPPDKVGHLRASPGLAPPSAIHQSTRALLILPEFDTLAEHSQTWVKALDKEGIAVHVEDDTGKSIGEVLQRDQCSIRIHQIKGMGHGFVTYPDAMLDAETRKAKALVMEQARRWIVGMLGGDAGEKENSARRVAEIAGGVVTQAAAALAKATA